MAQSPTVAAPIPDTRVLELIGIPLHPGRLASRGVTEPVLLNPRRLTATLRR